MKAVVFCHFHHRSAEYNKHRASKLEQQLAAQEENEIVESVLSYYKAYLKCKNIGLVYVYVDTGIRQVLDNIFMGEGKIDIDINELAFEHTVRNILKLAEDQALRELSMDENFDASTAPKFQFIGLPHLSTLIASLYRMDKDLVKNLAGRDSFTYDAPKFVEAVIRLARGNDPLLSGDPVLRFDQDVEVNEDGIDALLKKIHNAIIRRHGFSFFSGGYGRPDINDAVNDHAVRCHWLANIQDNDQPPYHLIPQGEYFLRDIGEFGATSIPNSKKVSASTGMKNYLINLHQGDRSANRDSEQVISGAGLYMSQSAILRLPPFMNFENNIIWVDDYLKRRLHEAIGDLAVADLEHVEGGLFHQDRYPAGIRQSDLDWAKNTYFYRLISGCIMHALIVTRTGEQSELAKFVDNFLRTHHRASNDEFSELAIKFMDIAQKTTLALLEIWSKADYGNDILQKWAIENQKELFEKGSGELAKWINSTVQDAIHYCKLVENWNEYVVAIQALVPRDAYWLFRSIN